MICTDTDNYVNVLSTTKKQKKKMVEEELFWVVGELVKGIVADPTRLSESSGKTSQYSIPGWYRQWDCLFGWPVKKKVVEVVEAVVNYPVGRGVEELKAWLVRGRVAHSWASYLVLIWLKGCKGVFSLEVRQFVERRSFTTETQLL